MKQTSPMHDKLNFGCGLRFSENWVNIDFHSEDRRVRRVNLLSGFPFPNDTFSAVYSGHVLEHFDRAQGEFLVRESWRVLRPDGILRIVVPDLQGTCAEYLRILSLPDGPEKSALYAWIIIEMLDQMVRNRPSGEMGPFMQGVLRGTDERFKSYIISRTQNTGWQEPPTKTLAQNLKKITLQKLATKISYWYLKWVSLVIPRSLRSMVFVQTGLGERHRWMYDEYGLKRLFQAAGFREVKRVGFSDSRIPGFPVDGLDSNPNGEPYKNNSIYMEGSK